MPLRTTLHGTVYESLSIKNYIKAVNKEYITTYNTGAKSTCSDKLWLLSCGEIWDNGYGEDKNPKINGTRGYAVTTEGKQYKYYKMKLGSTKFDSSNDITKKPSASNSKWWWLRSPFYGYSDYFCIVYSGGSCNNANASTSSGLAPGFSI